MEESAELDEISYVRFLPASIVALKTQQLENLLKQITQSSKKKKEK